MQNYRYKNAEEINSEHDNFEILKCQLTGTSVYKDIQWTLFCDRSGSMQGDRIKCLTKTLIEMFKYFIDDTNEKNNHHFIHIISFDDKVSSLHFEINKSSVIETLEKDIEKILSPRGMTNIGRALNVFNTTKYAHEVSMHNVIFMSDGQVTDGIEIVEQIGAVSTGNNGGHSDVPIENVIINEVTVIE